MRAALRALCISERLMRSFVVSLALLSSLARALEPVDARPVDAPSAWGTVGVMRGTEPLGDANVAVHAFTTYRAVTSAESAADRTMWLGDVGGAYGLTPRLTLAFSAPVLLRGYGVYGAPLTALGDARFVLAHTAVVPGVVGPGLAWSLGVRAPTGDRASGIAYAAPAATASIHGEYRAAIVELLAHAGVAAPLDEAASKAGVVPEAPRVVVDAGFGVTMRMRDLLSVGPTSPKVELASTLRRAASGSSAFDALFVHLSERFFLDGDEDVALVVSLGGTVSGPREAFGTVGLRYTPRLHDRDGDGVPDRVDQCPELEEDRDGFEDGDGCPEVDNDNDDVGDEDDKCPNEAGPEENHGCPLPKPALEPRDER
jgi:hypothetical protein